MATLNFPTSLVKRELGRPIDVISDTATLHPLLHWHRTSCHFYLNRASHLGYSHFVVPTYIRDGTNRLQSYLAPHKVLTLIFTHGCPVALKYLKNQFVKQKNYFLQSVTNPSKWKRIFNIIKYINIIEKLKIKVFRYMLMNNSLICIEKLNTFMIL